MNNLLLNCRQFVVFDASNKDHRRAYYEFISNSSWRNSRYQFIIEPGFEDVPTMCRIRLCEYYVNKEFTVTPLPKRYIDNDKLTLVKLPQR